MDIRDLPENAQRAKVVHIARSLLKPTVPWVHLGRSRGGMDCAGVLDFCFKEAGLVSRDYHTEFYAVDHMIHSDKEHFQHIIEQFCYRVERPAKDADIALFKVGRCISHCAIVDEWPRIIHAHRGVGSVDYADATAGEEGAKFVGIWTLKGWT